MRRRSAGSTFLALLAVCAAACDAGGGGTGISVRDSAGIAIIENGASAPAASWRLGEATVDIGALGSGEAYELYEPRHALRLADGRLVIANSGTGDLRFYAPDGTHIRTVGRKGGGPGEYQNMWGLVRLPGDSLGVWDWTAKRLTVYDDRGTFARLVTTTHDGGLGPRLAGVLDDRTFLVINGFDLAAIQSAGNGIYLDSIDLALLSLDDGAVLDTVGPFPAAERFAQLSTNGFSIGNTTFGREEHLAVGPGILFLGNDRTGEIRGHAPDGRPVRIIRSGHVPRPVTDEHVAMLRDQRLADVEEAQLPERRRRFDETPVAAALPAFGQLFADQLGRLWIEDFDLDPETPDLWRVLDPEGRLLARITLPPRLSPLDAGDDYLLAYTRDALDVEHVRLHPILVDEETR